MGTGLYFHVPFCAKKCPYCDFYSEKYSEEIVDKYINAVIRNVEKYKNNADCIIDSIYFGGGTPSLLSPQRLEKIINAVNKSFKLNNPEISIEVNPSMVNKEKFKALRNIGFNRISFGVQSFNDDELKKLGRLHNSDTAKKAIINAHESGFDNISADLMIGIIGQDIYSLYKNIEVIKSLPIKHISAYMLKIEENTPYNNEDIINSLPDDDVVSDLYLNAVKELGKIGLKQYEISNFAYKDFESRHNLHYWKCEEYIGIGPSAHSYFNGKRYAVPPSLTDFINNPFQKEILTDENPGDFEEYAMLRIRLSEGLDLNNCKERFNIDKENIILKAKPMISAGLVKLENSVISLTPKGFLLSNIIIGKLFVQ